MQNEINKLSGFANLTTAPQWRQLGTTSATVTVNFYALEAVGGDAVLSQLTENAATDALAQIDSATKTFYQGVYYSGAYTKIRVSSGTVLIRLQGN